MENMKININRHDVVMLRKPTHPHSSLWQIALLHELGYAFPTDVDCELPLSEYKVSGTRGAIRVIGRFVLIREVVMDGEGNALRVRGDKAKTRTVVRRLP